jgi:hypothetical protein
MDAVEMVRAVLKQGPGEPLCNACLAFACSTSLTEMWQTTAALMRAGGEFTTGPATCTSCRRLTTTFVYSGRPKCAHCSRFIHDDGLGITIGGDHFHRGCWQVLLSDERIRISRSLGRQSREILARARLRIDRPRRPTSE